MGCNMSNVAIIPARGGSKGIPKKNILSFCNKPLISWSITQALKAKSVDSVWVTSDCEEILSVAKNHGARTIKRPIDLASDNASSESAWIHALEYIESKNIPVNLVIGMQATSPLRSSRDLDLAVDLFHNEAADSMFTSFTIEDFFIWKQSEEGQLDGVNHDPVNRKPRQQIEKNYLENGSFYLFRPEGIRRTNNRLHGRIRTFSMDGYKRFQIDSPEDLKLCETIMRGYGLDIL